MGQAFDVSVGVGDATGVAVCYEVNYVLDGCSS
jgi:hypothetical protein